MASFASTVYSTIEKDAQMNRTAQRIRQIVLSGFSVYTYMYGFVVRKMKKLTAHMLKFYLYSICLQIHADYLTFLFEKKIFAKRIKKTLLSV